MTTNPAEMKFTAYYLRNLLNSKGGEALEAWCRVRAETVLNTLLPAWQLEGDYCRVGADGDQGRRCSLNLETFVWVDFADEETLHKGIVSFLVARLGMEALEQLRTLWQNTVGLGDKGSGMPIDLDAAIMPPPAPLQKGTVRRSVGDNEITQSWTYLDVDGTPLGKRIRTENKDGDKQVWTWTYRTAGVIKRNGEWHELPPGWHWRSGWGRVAPMYGLEDFGDAERCHYALQQGGGVLLVEGEKTRDAAVDWLEEIGERYRWLVLSWGNAGGVRRCWWEPLRALMNNAKALNTAENPINWQGVVVWPDADAAGTKAAYRVAEKLGSVRCVNVDELMTGGWTGWDLADPVPAGLVEGSGHENEHQWRWAKIAESTPVLTNARSAQENVNQYVYVQTLDKWWSTETRAFVGASQVDRWHGTVTGKDRMSLLLAEDPSVEKVSRVTYKPGAEEICYDRDPEGDQVVRCLNLWTPSLLEPDRDCSDEEAERQATVFIQHMENLVPDDETRGQVLDWLAWQVQRQGEKVSYSLVLQGVQGTGKSYLGVLMQRILGQNFISIDYETMTRDFNGWERGRSLILIEEAMAGNRKDFYNRMKGRITEPTIMINQKGMAEFKMHNRTNYMILTNEETPIYMDDGDRRFFVYFSPMMPRSPEYYERLFDHLDNCATYIYRWLLDRDLSEFKPNARAPETEAKRQIVESSRPVWQQVLKEAVDAKDDDFASGVCRPADICDLLGRRTGTRPSPTAIGKFLNRQGWEGAQVRDRETGRVVRLVYDPMLHESWQYAQEEEDEPRGFNHWLVDRWREDWR